MSGCRGTLLSEPTLPGLDGVTTLARQPNDTFAMLHRRASAVVATRAVDVPTEPDTSREKMPLPARAAAYTRTGILQRFLDETAASVPARVDNDYAETRLGLKGGDVRAFLQSLRVLGLVDPYGSVTDL